MRTLLFVLALVMFDPPNVFAQRKSAAPLDTSFSETRIKHLVEYLRVRPLYEAEIARKKLKYQALDRVNTVSGPLTGMEFHNDWCEYRKLNAREVHEMFDLGLMHYPKLRTYAGLTLKRDIKKNGFGLSLERAIENDYYSSDKGAKIADEIFRRALFKYKLYPCIRK